MARVFDSVLDESGKSPRLIGGRSRTSGAIVFPIPEGSEADLFDRILLRPDGKLWSFTIQRFPPNHPPYLGVTDPARFSPFAVGYVELENEVIVESRLLIDDFAELHIGMPMTLTTTTIETEEGARSIRTFAFEPV